MKGQKLDDIYRSHMKDIYFYIFSLCKDSYLAEDIVQETFYRAYLFLEDFNEERIKPWLFRVAYNAFVDFKRKNGRSLIKEDSFFKQIRWNKTPEEEFLKYEELNEIHRIIANIPDNQRQAIILCDFNDLSYKEAAKIMNVNLSHFKVILFRAREKVRGARKGDNFE